MRHKSATRLLAPVATVLSPPERQRVDAAGEGLYHTVHRDSLDDVLRDLRDRYTSAVLVSVARCGERDVAPLARMVREFPRIPAVALLTHFDPRTPQAVLSLGQSGVRTLVDVRHPAGWQELRQVLMSTHSRDIERQALSHLAADLAEAPESCRRFFDLLFTTTPRVSTVRLLARRLGVLPSTLMSRFFRAKLPAPKRYLAFARLTRAARLFENPGLSVANVANHLEYGSPQGFGRHVRAMLRLTAVEFRRQYDGDQMLDRFRTELVLPFLPVLRTFVPFFPRPDDTGTPSQ